MSERRLPRFSDVVGKEEAARLAAEEREAQQRIQRRRMEMIAARSPEYQRMRAERDALAATVERIERLCDAQGEDSYVMVHALRSAIRMGGDGS